MRRIVVLGGPGNGKSTLARQLAESLGLVHIELDGLFHGADWGSATDDEFREGLVVRMDAAPDGWVTCGNYVTKSRELHIARADTAVWLDLPRWQVTVRTAKRTVRRAISRERLFGTELVEPMTNFYRWDPDKNVIRWSWVYHSKYRADAPRYFASDSWSHLDVHHLRSSAEVNAFLSGVPSNAHDSP